jgi:hypothetical protein
MHEFLNSKGGVMAKMLMDMSDEELMKCYREKANHVNPSANDFQREIDRRAADRHERRILLLTVAATFLGIATTLATIYDVLK